MGRPCKMASVNVRKVPMMGNSKKDDDEYPHSFGMVAERIYANG